jgi:hypothetical protein
MKPSYHESNGELFERHRERRRAAATAESVSSSTNATASEAAAIQESLSRTQKLLQSELARVSAVQNAINEDEKMLRKTMDTQKSLNVKGAKRALTELERAKQQEQRILATAVAFFWLVVAYIVWCRILIRLPFVERSLRLIPWSLSYALDLFGL